MKMTNEEILEVLNAFDKGKKLEFLIADETWVESYNDKSDILRNMVDGGMAYRVKKEPVTETVTIYTEFFENELAYCYKGIRASDTHKITYQIIDGKKDLKSFRIEEL